jgi:O-antigen ligase
VIAEIARPAIERRTLAWLAAPVGVALLAGLSLAVNWLAPLAIMLALAGAVAFLRWPWLGFALLLVSVPIQQLGALGPLTLTRAAIPVALAGWLIWLTLIRTPLTLSRYGIVFGVWLGWLVVTLVDARDQTAAASEIARWVIAFLAFIVALQFLVGAPRERFVVLIVCMALAGALEATIGTILSLLAFGPESFQVGDAFSRAFGTFGRPNTFAGYLEMTVFPVAWLTVDIARRSLPTLHTYVEARRHGMTASRHERRQLLVSVGLLLLLGGSSAIMLAGITASFSRGAWLGVAIGALLSGLLFIRRAWLLVLAAAPVVILVGILTLSAIAPASLTERFTSIADELRPFDAASIVLTDENFSVAERMAHWQAGWRMFEDHPLTGVGAGNFNAEYPNYFTRSTFRFSRGHAHNYYIHVLAETGIVGLVLYLSLALGFLFLAIAVAWNAPNGTARVLALGAVGSMAAVMTHNVFENLHVLNLGIQISTLWALALAAHYRWRTNEPDFEEQNMEYSRG